MKSLKTTNSKPYVRILSRDTYNFSKSDFTQAHIAGNPFDEYTKDSIRFYIISEWLANYQFVLWYGQESKPNGHPIQLITSLQQLEQIKATPTETQRINRTVMKKRTKNTRKNKSNKNVRKLLRNRENLNENIHIAQNHHCYVKPTDTVRTIRERLENNERHIQRSWKYQTKSKFQWEHNLKGIA